MGEYASSTQKPWTSLQSGDGRQWMEAVGVRFRTKEKKNDGTGENEVQNQAVGV